MRQTVRLALLTLAVLLLAPLSAQAQIIAGSALYFDHTVEEQAFVAAYQLCVGTDCRDFGVTRVGTTVSLTGTIPAWVPKGRSEFTVRATWKAPLTGVSAPTNTLSLVVVGGPDRLRTVTQ